MILDSIRNLFNQPTYTYVELIRDDYDFVVVLKNAQGLFFHVRRETIINPASTSAPEILKAESALKAFTHFEFKEKLFHPTLAMILRAEMMGPDTVRLTFHPFSHEPAPIPFGYIMTLQEIHEIDSDLENVEKLKEIQQNFPTKSCIPLATRHNAELLHFLGMYDFTTPNKRMGSYISNKFE